ncbi:organic solute transporter subunit beta [Phascolarctos cinereus]|uniref:Organic solute transporter subunit beta n=1 Tax=Phascolarctos cinereus TaxID=38626 RepID=A0A6P5IM01_PHACI|nr:organic solute transporter subunit beta [Phascolarctos cinereus]
MNSSSEPFGARSEPGWSEEELQEMLWFYRTEDSTPWNIAVLALASVVFVLNVFLLSRNIMARRNRKMNSQDKQAVETKSSFEIVTNKEGSVSQKDDNSLDILKEKLFSQNQNPEQEMTELKETAATVISPESSEEVRLWRTET